MKRSTPAGARASAAEPSIRTTTSILQTQPADLVCKFAEVMYASDSWSYINHLLELCGVSVP